MSFAWRELTITNPLGLHARAAGKFVHLASRHACRIRVTQGETTVDGKSILGLLALAAACGTSIRIDAEGTDAEEALAALATLIEDRFGEDAVE